MGSLRFASEVRISEEVLEERCSPQNTESMCVESSFFGRMCVES